MNWPLYLWNYALDLVGSPVLGIGIVIGIPIGALLHALWPRRR